MTMVGKLFKRRKLKHLFPYEQHSLLLPVMAPRNQIQNFDVPACSHFQYIKYGSLVTGASSESDTVGTPLASLLEALFLAVV